MSQQVKVYRTLEFWYGGDKTLEFKSDASSTIVYVLPATDATEYLAFGDGTKNMDVKFFGATSGKYMLWDESANALLFTAANIASDTTTGMQIGTAATQKIGFFGATPVVQEAHIADASTAHDVSATFSDVEVEAALDALGTTINAILAQLATYGLQASA
jgi:hypothetical protein